MASAATMDILQEMAKANQIGSMIELVAEEAPEAHTACLVRWDFRRTGERVGVLSAYRVEIAVAAVGERRIEVGATPVMISLTAGAERRQVRITPRLVVPKILGFAAPGQSVYGEPLEVAWEVEDAATCTLSWRDGDRYQEGRVSTNGRVQLVPESPGMLELSLVASSRHAAYSELASVRHEARVSILGPPLALDVEQTRISAPIGDEAIFRWRTVHARAVRLEMKERDQQVLALPFAGELRVVAGFEQEVFDLVATSLGGEERRVQLTVQPRLFDLGGLPSEMNCLHAPWRGEP